MYNIDVFEKKEKIHSSVKKDQDSTRFRQSTQDEMQFKTQESCFSGKFHLIISGHTSPLKTEIADNKNLGLEFIIACIFTKNVQSGVVLKSKHWKQSKCPWIGTWISIMENLHNRSCLSIQRRKIIMQATA